MPTEFEHWLKGEIVDPVRVPQGWLDGPPPMSNPAAIETDEALARRKMLPHQRRGVPE